MLYKCTLKTHCPFKSPGAICQLKNNSCGYRKSSETEISGKYVRKERWYEKYYKS